MASLIQRADNADLNSRRKREGNERSLSTGRCFFDRLHRLDSYLNVEQILEIIFLAIAAVDRFIKFAAQISCRAVPQLDIQGGYRVKNLPRN